MCDAFQYHCCPGHFLAPSLKQMWKLEIKKPNESKKNKKQKNEAAKIEIMQSRVLKES